MIENTATRDPVDVTRDPRVEPLVDRPVSIHMHGLLYDKGSEGAPYADGSTAAQQGDDAVPPGTTYSPTGPAPDRWRAAR